MTEREQSKKKRMKQAVADIRNSKLVWDLDIVPFQEVEMTVQHFF